MSDHANDQEKQGETREEKGNPGSGKVNPAELPVPEVLPVLPLHGFVFFPGMGFPLQINHPASKQLVDDAILADRLVAVLTHRKGEEGDEHRVPEGDHLYHIGVVGYLHKLIKSEEGSYQVLMSAVKKLRVSEFTQQEPYLKARVETVPMAESDDQETEALVMGLRSQFRKMSELGAAPAELAVTVASLTNPFYIAYLITSQLNLSIEEEQEVLEIEEVKQLLRRTARELNKKLETVEMSHEIQKSMKEDMDKKQKEFFLREQLKAIRKELGEEDENLDLTELRGRLEKAELPEEARKTAQKELDRLGRISPSSPEYTVSRTYLDWILDLPWLKTTPDNLDIDRAEVCRK